MLKTDVYVMVGLLVAVGLAVATLASATPPAHRIRARTTGVFTGDDALKGPRPKVTMAPGASVQVRVGDLFDLSDPALARCTLVFSLESGAYASTDTIALHGRRLSNKEAGAGGWEFKPGEVSPDELVTLTVNDAVFARFSVGVQVTSSCYETFGSGVTTATAYVN